MQENVRTRKKEDKVLTWRKGVEFLDHTPDLDELHLRSTATLWVRVYTKTSEGYKISHKYMHVGSCQF